MDNEEQSSAGRSSSNIESERSGGSASEIPDELWKTVALMFLTHLKRCFGWRLNRTEPTLYESNMFDKADVNDTTLRTYLAWRRSQMMFSIPVLTSAAFTGLSAALKDNEEKEEKDRAFNESLNEKGNFVYTLPNIANFILLISVMGAIGFPKGRFRLWPKWRLSSKILRVGFIVAFILPIIPALIPLKYLCHDSAAEPLSDSLAELPGSNVLHAYSELKQQESTITVGIENFISALPVLVSFPSSLLAGSLRIRGLLPDSCLSSWILVATAPFLSIVMLAVSILIIQFGGNVPLMIGVFLRCFYPWMYVFRRGLYVKEATEEREKKVDCNQKFMLVMNIASMILIGQWLFTQDLIKSEDATNYVKFGLEIWGRFLATTVVFTDMLLRMTVTNWRVEKSVANQDSLLESIERDICKRSSREDDTNDSISDTLKAFSESMEDPEQGCTQSGDISSGKLINGTGSAISGSPNQDIGKTAASQNNTLDNENQDSTTLADEESGDSVFVCHASPHSSERRSSLNSLDIESGGTKKSAEELCSGGLPSHGSEVAELDKTATSIVDRSTTKYDDSNYVTSLPEVYVPEPFSAYDSPDIETGDAKAVIHKSPNSDLPVNLQASLLSEEDAHTRSKVLHESKINAAPPENMSENLVTYYDSKDLSNETSEYGAEGAVVAVVHGEYVLDDKGSTNSLDGSARSNPSRKFGDDDAPECHSPPYSSDNKSGKEKPSILKHPSSSLPADSSVSFAIPPASMSNMSEASSEVFHDSRSDMEPPETAGARYGEPATVNERMNKIDGIFAPGTSSNQAEETSKGPAQEKCKRKKGWRMMDEKDLDEELMEGIFESSSSLGRVTDTD